MTARDFALIELDSRSLPTWPAGSLRRTPKVAPPKDPRDVALAEQIVRGVIKNLLLLQHLIQHYAGRSRASIDPPVQKILAIGLYQLRFLTRIPASAAVDEAVEQSRRFRLARAGGFVNAVLRNATREPDLPLPTVEDDPRRYAQVVLSHPPELVDRLVTHFGMEKAIQICRHDNEEPPTVVRLFRGVTLEDLATEGVTITPHEQHGLAVVEPAKAGLLADYAARGLAQAQDPTSAKVAEFCDIRPGQRVLDRCCGRGTKTLQIQDALGPEGYVLAIDPNERRLASLSRLVEGRDIRNVDVRQAALLSEMPDLVGKTFDRILIDAPCSNSGVLARRPEARYVQQTRSLSAVRELQEQILRDSLPFLAPDGLLIYSTCSIWPEENQQVVADLLALEPALELLSESVTLPSAPGEVAGYHDGGYVAVCRRR